VLCSGGNARGWCAGTSAESTLILVIQGGARNVSLREIVQGNKMSTVDFALDHSIRHRAQWVGIYCFARACTQLRDSFRTVVSYSRIFFGVDIELVVPGVFAAHVSPAKSPKGCPQPIKTDPLKKLIFASYSFAGLH